MTAAITATNRQIRELASVLLAPAIESVFSTRRSQIKIGARRVGRTTYLIAVNPYASRRVWSRKLPGLTTQKVASSTRTAG